MSTIKARPTVYKGIQMRSRLEARFAQLLDTGLPNVDRGRGLVGWEYEPECFADESGQYLPDFWAPGAGDNGSDVYYEVKSEVADHAAALQRMHIIRSTHPNATLQVVTQVGGQQERFTSVGYCSKGHPCEECRLAIQWTQEQAQDMYDMILAHKRFMADLNQWVDALLGETRCLIGNPVWLEELIAERPGRQAS